MPTCNTRSTNGSRTRSSPSCWSCGSRAWSWIGASCTARPSRGVSACRRIPLPKSATGSTRSPGGHVAAQGAATAVLHPLLHRNTSDLSEQRYQLDLYGRRVLPRRSSGDDERPRGSQGAAGRGLSGNGACGDRARLARAARIDGPGAAQYRLGAAACRRERTDVSIALAANDREQIDYEIYSQESRPGHHPLPGLRALEPPTSAGQARSRQLEGADGGIRSSRAASTRRAPAWVWSMGPPFRELPRSIGEAGQLLAQLRLPSHRGGHIGRLCPSSECDGRRAAGCGRIGRRQARIRPTRDCRSRWTRCASSRPAVETWSRGCDTRRAAKRRPPLSSSISICAMSTGTSVCNCTDCLRERLASEIATAAAQGRAIGRLLATPVWQATDAAASSEGSHVDYTQHHVILCELSTVQRRDAGVAGAGQ